MATESRHSCRLSAPTRTDESLILGVTGQPIGLTSAVASVQPCQDEDADGGRHGQRVGDEPETAGVGWPA